METEFEALRSALGLKVAATTTHDMLCNIVRDCIQQINDLRDAHSALVREIVAMNAQIEAHRKDLANALGLRLESMPKSMTHEMLCAMVNWIVTDFASDPDTDPESPRHRLARSMGFKCQENTGGLADIPKSISFGALCAAITAALDNSQ